MDLKRNKELHRKFLNRELSDDELKEYFHQLKSITPEELVDVEEVAENYAVDWEPNPEIALGMIRRDANFRRYKLMALRGIAAMLALIVTAGSIIGYEQYVYVQKTKHFFSVSVPVGKAINLKLHDGSVITLESGSVFKYPELFPKMERRVYLIEGRAFFKVAKDKSKPFTVESGKLQTTALGTSFTIQHYRNYGFEKVSLFTGKVKVDRKGSTGKAVIMHPGQEYEFAGKNTTTGILSLFEVAKDPMNKGTLQFEDTPFSEAIYRIASYFHVKIHFDEKSFLGDYVSGNVNSSSAQELLKSLSHINRFNINQINQSEFKIMKKNKRK